MKLIKQKTIWWPTWQCWILLFLIFAGLLFGLAWNVYRFLAITNRVTNADILVVEAWVPDVVIQATAREFKQGSYRFLIISDLHNSAVTDNKLGIKINVVDQFTTLGIPKDHIIECIAPATNNHQSATMAAAVRKTLQQSSTTLKGINIVAPAAHARKTWLVYRRALTSQAPVGIVAVPTEDYDPAHWWRTTEGAKWVIGNSIGWLYELVAGK